MADYDLGSAHGKVRIEGDTSGVEAVNRKLDEFKRALTDIVGRVGVFQAGMNRIESELRQVKNDFQSATQAADQYNRTVTVVHVSNQRLSQSTNILGRDFRSLATDIGAVAAAHALHIAQLARLGNEFNKSSGGIIGFTAALQRSGTASIAFSLLTARFLGVSKALENVPTWQRHILNFSNSIRVATVAFAGFRALSGDLTERMFRSIASSSEFAGIALDRFGKTVGGFLGNLSKVPQGLAQSIVGLAVFRNGLNGLLAPIRGLMTAFEGLSGLWKTVIGVLAVAGPGIVEGLALSLRFLSNAFVGLLSSAEQLAGGLLAIPGGFALIGAAAVPLMGILFTLKTRFADLFKDIASGDAQKVAQDLARLPSYLQPLGQIITQLIPQWKALGDSFAAIFTGGLDTQLRALSDTYLPAIGAGGNLVAGQFKNMKDQFVGFLMQSQTVADVNQLFVNTAGVMSTVASAIQPVLQGLRDIGIVGSEFIKELVQRYLPGISAGFADWAAKARESGRLMNWMKQSVEAAKELWVGIKNVAQATWTLLTLFKTTGGGENFLKGFADSMTRFHAAVQQSATSGGLKQISDAVKNMGTGHLQELGQLISSILPLIGQVITFVAQLGMAFSGTFGTSLAIAIQVLRGFLAVLNSIGGGEALGTILGLVGAWKLLAIALGPIRGLIQLVVGAFSLMKGIDTLVTSMGIALEGMGSVGKVAADKLVGGFTAIRGAIGLAAGALTAAIVGFALYQQGAQEIDSANKAMRDSMRHSDEAVQSLKQALTDDRGIAGNNVFTALKQSVDTAMQDLEQQANAAPGVLARITDFLRGGNEQSATKNAGMPSWMRDIIQGIPIVGSYLNFPTGSSGEVNQADATAKAAKSTQDALSKTHITATEAARAIAAGGPAYNDLINKLKALGTAGQPAIDFLQKQRDLYTQTIGPAQQFADVGQRAATSIQLAHVATRNWDGSASTLVQVLARIGITADQANTAIMGSADEFAKFLKLLEQSKAPTGLIDGIKQLRSQFENGGAAVKQFTDAINKMGDSTVSAEEKANAFVQALQQMGTIPLDTSLIKYNEDIQNAIGYQSTLVDMLDKTGASLIVNGNQLDLNSKNGRTLSTTIQQLVTDSAALVESGRASPEEAYAHTSEALRRLLSQFAVTDPATQQKIIDSYFPASAFKEAIKTADPKSALEALFKNDPAKLNASITLLDSNQDIVNRIVGPDGKLHLPTVFDPTMPAATPPVPPGPPPAPPGPPAPAPGPQGPLANLTPTGPPAGQPPLGADDPAKLMVLMMGHPDISAALQPFIDQAAARGENLSQAFADGIQNGSPAVKDAIIKLAQLAGDGLGSSPAKYGPLSGDGWTYNRGQNFSADWAGGISAASGIVKNAVKDAAYGAVTGMKELPNNQFQQLLDLTGFLGHLVDFGKQIIDIFQSLNTLSGGALSPKRYVPDPLIDRRRGTSLGDWSPQGWKPPTGGDTTTGTTGGVAPITVNSDGTISSPNAAWQHLIARESGGHNIPQKIQDANSGPNAAQGYFQITPSTWAAHGGTQFAPNPMAATPQQQAQIAARILQANPSGSDWGAGMAGRESAADLLAGITGGTVPVAGSAGPGGPIAPPPAGVANALGVGKFLGAGGGTTTDAVKAAIAAGVNLPVNYAPGTSSGGYGQTKGLPQWMIDLGAQFGLIPSTYPGGGSLHQAGYAADFVPKAGSTTGSADMDRFAQYITQNLMANTIELIHASGGGGAGDIKWGIAGGRRVGPGTDMPGYFSQAWGGHSDVGPDAHVHWAPVGLGPGTVAPAAPPPGAVPPPAAPPPGVPPAGVAQRPLGPAPAGQTWDYNTGKWVPAPGTAGAPAQPALAPPPAPGSTVPPGTTPANPVNVALPQQDSNALQDTSNNTSNLGDLNALTSVPQKLQDIGVPQNITNQADAVTALQSIDTEVARQNNLQTPQGKLMAEGLGQVHSEIQQKFGLKQAPSALDVASSIGGLAGDFVGDIQAGIEAIGAGKNIGDMLVRGIASTNDILGPGGLIDNVQKFIDLAAKITKTVGDVASTIGSMTGGADMGLTSGIGQVTQLIAGIIQAVNTAIDLGQEAWHIFGSYFGQFLGFLAGGNNMLMGNVKFLLDQNTGQLLAYSSDNPLNKTPHPIPGAVVNPAANNQAVGQLNYYAGPGQDPRDSTRQMMYQVQASQMNTVTAQ